MKKNRVIRFVTILLSSLIVTFSIHLCILFLNHLNLFENKIVVSYIINFLMASGIFATLFFLKDRFKNYIGFLFIGGGLLKFLIFFVIFYPSYKSDGDISRLEFSAFFIPYLVCLIIETSGLTKLLKNL